MGGVARGEHFAADGGSNSANASGSPGCSTQGILA